jgi:hypothetical protein
MARSTLNPLQEQQLSHGPAAFGNAQQHQESSYYGAISMENHAATSAPHDMDARIFEGEPHINMQDTLYAPNGSSLQFTIAGAKSQPVFDKLTTKERRRAERSAAKQAKVPKMQPQPFTLQKWSDEPSTSDPYFLLPNPSANHANNAAKPQDMAWNFLEGELANDQFQNRSMQDELVCGAGAWASEGT